MVAVVQSIQESGTPSFSLVRLNHRTIWQGWGLQRPCDTNVWDISGRVSQLQDFSFGAGLVFVGGWYSAHHGIFRITRGLHSLS